MSFNFKVLSLTWIHCNNMHIGQYEEKVVDFHLLLHKQFSVVSLQVALMIFCLHEHSSETNAFLVEIVKYH